MRRPSELLQSSLPRKASPVCPRLRIIRDPIARLNPDLPACASHADRPAAQVHAAQAGKLLIFTEHRDTLVRLAERLEDKGYTVATIHGGMDVDSRKQAQRQFRTHAKIMVATDAAGEGINLQFCRYLINWDIPWNPNRLEQRMGRTHRYGQAGDVWVYNLVAQNTREGSVLQKVLSKLDVMRERMGSDRVYDVIDEWLEDVPLVRPIESAIDAEDESASAQETDAALATASKERAERLMALSCRVATVHPARSLDAWPPTVWLAAGGLR